MNPGSRASITGPAESAAQRIAWPAATRPKADRPSCPPRNFRRKIGHSPRAGPPGPIPGCQSTLEKHKTLSHNRFGLHFGSVAEPHAGRFLLTGSSTRPPSGRCLQRDRGPRGPRGRLPRARRAGRCPRGRFPSRRGNTECPFGQLAFAAIQGQARGGACRLGGARWARPAGLPAPESGAARCPRGVPGRMWDHVGRPVSHSTRPDLMAGWPPGRGDRMTRGTNGPPGLPAQRKSHPAKSIGHSWDASLTSSAATSPSRSIPSSTRSPRAHRRTRRNPLPHRSTRSTHRGRAVPVRGL